ncbi:GNAT family N-acetyltransferase [Marivita sp.]|uniref:GNAT family N-acetyltransferase n=1 Tax=Marivita sp. TaxID=2003365 RepID=UPI003A873697
MMRMGCETASTGVAASIAAQLSEQVPVLRTDRLVLRAPRVGDFDCLADIACSERGRGIGGPMTRADAWREFVQLSSGWMLHGHGGWTLEDAQTGDVLGFVLIGFEPGDLEPELGFLLDAKAEGQSIAYEAGRCILDFATDVLKWTTLVSYIDPANSRSIALAERLGAEPDGEIVEDDEVTLVYRYTLAEVL